MKVPSTRFSQSNFATTFVNVTYFLGLILSACPETAFATTTTSSTRSTARPTTSSKPGYSILPFFLPDSEPLSLVASIVHKTTIITTTIISPKTTFASLAVQTLSSATPTGGSETEEEITLKINCPTALTPENEACRSAKIYPALVTGRRLVGGNGGAGEVAQTQVWKGETTYLVGNDATTTWTCWQGMSMRTAAPEPTPGVIPAAGGNGGVVPYAECVSTIVQEQGSNIRYVTRRYDECYFYRHMVPLVVMADERRSDQPGGEGREEADKMNGGWDVKLAQLGCVVEEASRTMWAGSVKTEVAVVTGTGVPATSGSVGMGQGQHIFSKASIAMLWAIFLTLGGSLIHAGVL